MFDKVDRIKATSSRTHENKTMEREGDGGQTVDTD
jgi:hypothetical protein